MTTDANVVSARPTKVFFVDMITRDLGITDCILDLIDNAIDHAVMNSKLDVMTFLTDGSRPLRLRKYYVSLKLSGDSFRIEDNCGGISIDDARTRVFRFGDPENRQTQAGLSVYGIGMKRAFFKLGQVIRVQSATTTEWFVVDINVKRWKAKGDDDWDFTFASRGALRKSGPQYQPSTTRISIAQLNADASLRFSQPSFRKQLLFRIASTYSLFLTAGLRITVNGEPVKPNLPTIGGLGSTLSAARKQLTADGVDILIIAGVTPRDDKQSHGWYVFCNGRMVLEADQSRLTGWGDNLPQWHSKYRHFAGYVYFRSADVRLLPWTTTKQGVVYESRAYQTALAEMQVQARPILNFLNNLYPGDLTEEEVAEREVLTRAHSVDLTKLSRREAPFIANVESERKRKENALINIQYKKPKKLIEQIRSHLGRSRMSASSVGKFTFDYYLKQEIE